MTLTSKNYETKDKKKKERNNLFHISINEVRNINPYLRSLYFATINTLQGVSMLSIVVW